MMLNRILAALVVVAVLNGGAAAQSSGTYPAKSIRIIVPYAPGGPTDVLSRVYAVEVGKGLGQQVVVENKPGAGGTVGMGELARSTPDGYVIALGTPSTNITAPFLQKGLAFNAETAFAPVSYAYLLDIALVVNKELPVANLQEFLAYAKANPGKLVFGTEGPGSTTFLIGEMIKQRTGITYLHVPYKGQSQFVQEMLAGRVNFSVTSLPLPMQYHNEGKLKILAVGSDVRVPQLPNVPTFGEQGLPGFDLQTWGGWFVPAGTNVAVIRRLSQEFRRAAALPDVQAKLMQFGMIAKASTPEELETKIKASRAMWGEVIQKAGIKPE